MIGTTNSGFQLIKKNLQEFTYIWAAQGTPSISYTYSVPSVGYYLGVAMRGDTSYTMESTGTMTPFIIGANRRLVVYTFYCEIGQTITIGANNKSSSTNCRTEAALFYLSGEITKLSIPYNNGANDTTVTYSYSMGPGKYLICYGQCGNLSDYTTVGAKNNVSTSNQTLIYDINEWKSNSNCLNMYIATTNITSGSLNIANGGKVGTAGGINMVVFSIQ